MRTVRRRGVFIRRWILILLLVLLLVSVMMTLVMMMVAIRRRSITGTTQECSHRQLVVKLDIRSSSHIHGRWKFSKGIGKVEPMMLLMLLMSVHRRRTPRGRRRVEQIAKWTVIACGRAAGSRRRIVRMKAFNTVKCLSLERSLWWREEGHCRSPSSQN